MKSASISLALHKIEVTSADGTTTLAVSEAPHVAMRWEDLCREPGPDVSRWSFWCPRCGQCPMWVRDASGRAAEKGATLVSCWSQCFECKSWVLIADKEIEGASVLSRDECDVARVMET